jgi:hypothetical protein
MRNPDSRLTSMMADAERIQDLSVAESTRYVLDVVGDLSAAAGTNTVVGVAHDSLDSILVWTTGLRLICNVAEARMIPSVKRILQYGPP